MLAMALAAIAGALGQGAAAVPPGWRVVAQAVEEFSCDPAQTLVLAT